MATSPRTIYFSWEAAPQECRDDGGDCDIVVLLDTERLTRPPHPQARRSRQPKTRSLRRAKDPDPLFNPERRLMLSHWASRASSYPGPRAVLARALLRAGR